MFYNKDNIFYKIINKELKANILIEGEYFIAINDIAPKAPVHMLMIPKGEYIDYYEFATRAKDEEMVEVTKGIAALIEMMCLQEGGYKIISNSKAFGEQEIMHFHFHILGKVAQ